MCNKSSAFLDAVHREHSQLSQKQTKRPRIASQPKHFPMLCRARERTHSYTPVNASCSVSLRITKFLSFRSTAGNNVRPSLRRFHFSTKDIHCTVIRWYGMVL